ncbi:MAG: response regulator [Phycisphaerales bacterium]
MSIRILLVDDEPMILQGIKRWLRSAQPDWRPEIAAGGEQAIEMLKNNPYDVVVTDMRMPGVDGADLLLHVKEYYPNTSRIVLSGYCDHEMALRTVTSAHQYLSKPCDANTLCSAIERSTALNEVLDGDVLRTLIARIDVLPSPPKVYNDLLDQINCPEPSAKDIARTLSKDPAVTAKVLQLVNSSFFGLSRHIEAVEQAVPLLGVELIKTLVLSAGLFKLQEILPEAVGCVSNHCYRVGCIARKFAQDTGLDEHAEMAAFTAGMLHDVGKLIMAQDDPAKYTRLLRKARSNGVDIVKLERETYGASHAELGAYLLSLWNLPHPIVEAVAYHHEPSACVVDELSAVTAVHVANALLYRDNDGQDGMNKPVIDTAHLEHVDPEGKATGWIQAYENITPEARSA